MQKLLEELECKLRGDVFESSCVRFYSKDFV